MLKMAVGTLLLCANIYIMAEEVDSNYDKNNPFLAKMLENSLLSQKGSIKDTRHLVVDLTGSGLTYTCGDSLGVYASNIKANVDAVLSAIGATGDEQVTLPRQDDSISLLEALSTKLSLAAPTRKSLMVFRDKVESTEEQAMLDDLLDAENKESTASYLADREFLDLLEEFPSAKFTAQEFVALLRKLMPRLYSIASSPVKYPDQIHLTVAIVRYETNGKKRNGVCSTYMSERVELNDPSIPVFVANSHFALPEDESTNVIMVGPGTGIAPFRAFLQERVAKKSPGKNWLYFGDQHVATDYLYGDEFEAYKANGDLHKLSLAWSRDQVEKVYVQDKMLEEGADMWSWINSGASFFICGDAKRMAKDVDRALHTIAQTHGGLSEDEAVAYFKQMKKDKRYLRDVY